MMGTLSASLLLGPLLVPPLPCSPQSQSLIVFLFITYRCSSGPLCSGIPLGVPAGGASLQLLLTRGSHTGLAPGPLPLHPSCPSTLWLLSKLPIMPTKEPFFPNPSHPRSASFNKTWLPLPTRTQGHEGKSVLLYVCVCVCMRMCVRMHMCTCTPSPVKSFHTYLR